MSKLYLFYLGKGFRRQSMIAIHFWGFVAWKKGGNSNQLFDNSSRIVGENTKIWKCLPWQSGVFVCAAPYCLTSKRWHSRISEGSIQIYSYCEKSVVCWASLICSSVWFNSISFFRNEALSRVKYLFYSGFISYTECRFLL